MPPNTTAIWRDTAPDGRDLVGCHFLSFSKSTTSLNNIPAEYRQAEANTSPIILENSTSNGELNKYPASESATAVKTKGRRISFANAINIIEINTLLHPSGEIYSLPYSI